MDLLVRPYWCRGTYNLSIPSTIKWSCGEAKQNNKECLGKSTGCTSGWVVAYHYLMCSFCASHKSIFVNKILANFLIYNRESVLPIDATFSLAEGEMNETEIFDEETFERILASGTRIHREIQESAFSNISSRQAKERLWLTPCFQQWN